MRKTILKWLLLTILLAYAATITIWAGKMADAHVCSGIKVSIANSAAPDSVTYKGVMAELGKYPGKIVGEKATRIDTRKIEQYLARYSNFESVNCLVATDGELDVRIVPMIPAMRVFDGNQSYYINKDGKRIESKASFFVDVPVVAGKFSENFTPLKVLPLSRFVAADPVLSKVIAMIQVKDADNILLIPRIHGHVINFGDTTRLEEKRDALLAMYRKVMPYKGWQTYDTISVKFHGQVVASRRDKSKVDHGSEPTVDVDPDETTLFELTDPHEE